MAEKEGDHRRDLEKLVNEGNVEAMRRSFSEAKLGQILAFVISISFVGAGTYVVAVVGQPWAGIALSALGIGGIVTSFINGRQKPESDDARETTRRKNRPPKRKQGTR